MAAATSSGFFSSLAFQHFFRFSLRCSFLSALLLVHLQRLEIPLRFLGTSLTATNIATPLTVKVVSATRQMVLELVQDARYRFQPGSPTGPYFWRLPWPPVAVAERRGDRHGNPRPGCLPEAVAVR